MYDILYDFKGQGFGLARVQIVLTTSTLAHRVFSIVLQQLGVRDSAISHKPPVGEAKMIKPSQDTQLGQQAQAGTTSETPQSKDAYAEHREAIAGITKGLSQALAGRGVEARRFFQDLEASRG